ncbi:MAG: sulfotransferase, partial [Myxococcales bacterium]|nr:sulfotransferase [Myxococcales bacterium]
MLARRGTAPGPQLFILGLPRTGTTLIYQYIVHRCAVAYFTNSVGRRFHDPCRATWRDISAHPPYRSDFTSRYGRSEGVMAPREAGNFWLRFFDIDAYQRFADVAPRKVEALRRAVRCVQALFGGAPFVSKNVKHLLRIDALARIFRDGHFLVVERDRSDVGLSILRARREVGGSSEAWFSARPPEYDSLRGCDPVEQVCAQIVGLERRLAADLAALDA